MTDFETELRAAFHAYADETAVHLRPPPPSLIAARADERRRRLPHWPKPALWPKLAAAAAGGVLLTTGVAAAVGELPGPVSAVLSEMRSWGFDVTNEHAQRMASASRDDMTYELWVTSGPSGDECMFVRVTRAGVDMDHGGGSQCTYDDPMPPEQLFVAGTTPLLAPWDDRFGRHPTLAGRLPVLATHVELDLSDGTTRRWAAESTGWFLVVLPTDVPDGTRLLSARATTADGRTVAQRAI
jgi:hypothetical protein